MMIPYCPLLWAAPDLMEAMPQATLAKIVAPHPRSTPTAAKPPSSHRIGFDSLADFCEFAGRGVVERAFLQDSANIQCHGSLPYRADTELRPPTRPCFLMACRALFEAARRFRPPSAKARAEAGSLTQSVADTVEHRAGLAQSPQSLHPHSSCRPRPHPDVT